ncbi:MAG: hypothetical protein KGM98_08880, partial [Bacteroidota bacterium]|nr:hypothetical protein [Bacteroidota bacterium]
DDPGITDLVHHTLDHLLDITQNGKPDPEEVARFTAKVRQEIQPYNIARLLDPALKNMYRHTAAIL